MTNKNRLYNFYTYNIILLILLHAPFWINSNSISEFFTLSYSFIIAFAQSLTIYFLIASFTNILTLGKASKLSWFTKIFLILLTGFLNYFYIVDYFIYKLFKFHFNGLAWNVISTPEGIASMNLPPSTYYLIFGLLALFIALEVFIMEKVSKINFPFRFPLKFKSKYMTLTSMFLLTVTLDKGIYAYGDINNTVAITKAGKFYPMYFPMLVRDNKSAGLEGITDEFVHSETSSKLNYPHSNFHKISKDSPNILMIVLDSWRFDQLNSEVTPNISKLAESSYSFENHHSGGNGTRHGIFSLIYGVHSSYWQRFLAERKGPALITSLKENDYRFKVLSSASLKSPEFRLTAFVDVTNDIEDDFKISPIWKRDKELTNRFKLFTRSLSANEKFYSFILLDSTHSGYSYPKESEKFLPVNPEGSFTKMIDRDTAQFTKNRYKNSIYYADSLVGEIVEDLKQKGLYENTIIIVTGDHGEEFYENGYFGHHGAFTKYQTQVPLVLHVPHRSSQKGGQKIKQLTSHQDIVPTIFSLIGSETPSKDYSNGHNLFDTEIPRDFVISCSFYDCSIIHDAGHIIFGTEAHTLMRFELRDNNYDVIENPKDQIKKNTSKIAGAIKETSKFYK